MQPPILSQPPNQCRSRRGGRSPGRGDGGSAAIASIVIVAGIVLVLTAVTLIAGAINMRAHAQRVADLSALAAATEWNYVPGSQPCDRAQEVAQRNGAHLTACEINGSDVQVTVEAESSALDFAPASATARAGPARAAATDQATAPRQPY